MADPLITAVSVAATKELFKKLVLDLYEIAKSKSSLLFREMAIDRKVDQLYKEIATVRRVKTIWQLDRAVDLKTFYCHSHVRTGQKRKRITQLSDFSCDENILVQGIAGQGKSIFLRYLCAVELERAQFIPIFLELRRVTSDAPLMTRILHAFAALNLRVDEELFRALAASGKVLLLLDAFDEVPDELKSQVLNEIEDLADTNRNLRIVVTSRPNHNIHTSTHFSVVTLDNLIADEYQQVIERLASGQKWANELIEHIEVKARHVRELLCTPLMVTLLVLSYKSYQKMPSKLSDFYDSLFFTLLQRHDGTKPGFKRQKSCDLDDSAFRSAFEALCICARKRNQQSYPLAMMVDIASEALAHCSIKCEPDAFVGDIVRITCLINRDGEEHRFIHKTVHEYYTASFVQKKPQMWAKQFYDRLLKSNSHREWEKELDFLSEIDTYRFNKFFLFPAILDYLGVRENQLDAAWKPLEIEQVAGLLSPYQLMTKISGRGLDAWRIHWLPDLNYMQMRMLVSIFNRTNANRLSSELFQLPTLLAEKGSSLEAVLRDHGLQVSDRDGMQSLSLGKAVLFDGLPSTVKVVQRECAALFLRARAIRDAIKQDESSGLLEGLV